ENGFEVLVRLAAVLADGLEHAAHAAPDLVHRQDHLGGMQLRLRRANPGRPDRRFLAIAIPCQFGGAEVVLRESPGSPFPCLLHILVSFLGIVHRPGCSPTPRNHQERTRLMVPRSWISSSTLAVLPST